MRFFLLSFRPELPEVTMEMAVERLEQLVNLAASCLSAFVHIPLKGQYAVHGKRKVACIDRGCPCPLFLCSLCCPSICID